MPVQASADIGPPDHQDPDPRPDTRRSRSNWWARVGQLLIGLVSFGISLAFMVRSDLGLDPWDVFHQGLAVSSGLPIGSCTILVGVVVLLLWIPLRQRPGIGTIANVILVGLSLDATLFLLGPAKTSAIRWAFLIAGIVLNGIATGAYIGAGLGPGPRDGLMVGLARRGISVRVARTIIEVSILIAGYLLGGTIGIGTVLYAASIGPIVHVSLPFFSGDRPEPSAGRRVRRGQR